MELSGVILEIAKIIWAPIGKCVKYHRSLEEKMILLHNKLEVVNSRKEDIESRMNVELCLEKQLKKEVQLWLENVQKMNGEVETIDQEVGEGKFLSRAHLGKLVIKKIQEVEELHQKGSFNDSLVVDGPDGNRVMLPTAIIVGDTTRRNMDEIWACLMDNDVRKVGVHGIGGVGKTTIMKHIYNQLLIETGKFENAVWITVPKATSVIQLQSKIAHAFQLGLSENESETIRAAKLLAMLRMRKRYVLILDDLWEEFELEEIGIPEPTRDNECKLVLTTRLSDVCVRMGCKKIKVQLLSENETWNLFLEKVGRDLVAPEIETIAKDIAKECGRLPLAIITIARSMKGVVDHCEWRNALEELRVSTSGLNDMGKVYEQLKFSYIHLQDERLRHCLLYCALYPEDFLIGRKELIEHLIAGGVIEGMKNKRAEFDRGHAMLNKLENSCLLESVVDQNKDMKWVKMHDLIRDMALQITSTSPRFLVEAGVYLRNFPDIEKWAENLEKVSLMHNYISEVPSNLSPKCHRLSTLLLSSNHTLTLIPNSFFVHMHALQVLDLSDTGLEILPDSVSGLDNLTALLLRGCYRLKYVPSLAKMKVLMKLDFSHSGIKEVPQGQLYDQNDFNAYVRCLQEQGPNNYFIRVGEGNEAIEEEMESLQKEVQFTKCNIGRGEDMMLLPGDIQTLQIIKCHDIISLSSISSLNNASELKTCVLADCNGIECILQQSSYILLQNLESLALSRLCNLCDLFRGERAAPLPPGTFSALKKLSIAGCPIMKKLFEVSLLLHFKNLEALRVYACYQMKEIIATGHEYALGESSNLSANNDFTVSLPQLRYLSLDRLPQLESIYRGTMVCYSLEVIQVFGCPKLKRIPLSLPHIVGQPSPPPKLQRISTNIWEALEWDHPNAKSVLQPLVQSVLTWSNNHGTVW
ncbi:probable disease resistance protein At5g63020 isoform X2 [Quercus lobata]|uniref:probable disease resistance protein At5g63020 isoform X2 n=1 Tax=Quercus lobata TaxID=97700 RepID=UPI0012483F10|nr:probable disease resistance protein At5g63020 isoform X2 [Quercus lobata]